MAGFHPRTVLAHAAHAAAVILDARIERDQLTGLRPREQLMRRLHEALAHRDPVAVLYVDLDDFKLVNDTLGHAAGDDLLRRVAAAMRECAGSGDLLARQGGDEFVLVTQRTDGVQSLAERLRETITAPLTLHGVRMRVGVSIGIAVATSDTATPHQLLEAADAAMYDAKRNGRNQISRTRVGSALDRSIRRRSLELTVSLPEAIARDELLLHWQPLVDIRDLSIIGLEALLRWKHPQRGLLYPDAFLPFAEETGMIHAVDHWVADAVSRQRLQWQAEGLDPYVGFNLAPQFARQPDALESLLSRLTVGGLSLDHVTIELTESEALREDHRLVRFLDGLHDAGVTISLDDFGRAYSSLERLRDVPARWVKLDRAFMSRVPGDHAATEVLFAILDLIRALKLELIVEGIENPEQLAVLRSYGHVIAAQGFLLGHPLPAAELEGRLRQSPPSLKAAGVTSAR